MHLTGVRRGPLIVLAALALSLLVVLALVGPQPDRTVSGVIRRRGGVCLELEKWGLLGWTVIGQSYTVSDIGTGTWHPPVEEPPCTSIPEALYLIRLPFDAPSGVYRICGLADDQGCTEFRRVPFVGTPGP